MATNMTFVDFVTPVPADWLNNVNTVVNSSGIINYTAPFAGATTLTINSKLSQIINVLDFGADPTGVSDATTHIQAAITAAGVGGTVIFPSGSTFLVSATLNGLQGQTLRVDAHGSAIIKRTGDYGDTLVFAQAQYVVVRGLWFQQSTLPSAPFTTIANQITVHTTSAHIRLQNAANVVIEDCIMWRMPYGVAIDQGSLVWINRCHAQGVWDGVNVGAQEGIAGIQVGGVGYTQIVKITECYFAGSGNGPRNVTYTSSDTGSHVQSLTQDVGNQYAILIDRCEDLLIANNYMGGNWNSCIFSNPAAGSVNLDWRITGNLIDGAGQGGALIYFTTQSDGKYPSGVSITSNVFNGEQQAFNAITCFNPFGNNPTLVNFTITGNTLMATPGSAMMFYHAQGGTISGNSIIGYNCYNASAGADLTFSCGVWFGPQAHYIQVYNNNVGGSVNTASSPSNCYQGIYLANSDGTVMARHNYIIGGGLSGNLVGRQDETLIVYTGSSNYQITYETWVSIQQITPTSISVVLPSNVPVGYTVGVKDGGATAAGHPITVVGTVDGSVNPVYNTNLFSHRFMWNGSGWLQIQ